MLDWQRRSRPLPNLNGHGEYFSQRFLKTIAQVLIDTEQGQWRPGKEGRRKVRFSCLWHDDPNPSCDYYPDDGWCYCHGCATAYPVRKLALALDLPVDAETPPGRAQSGGVPNPVPSPFYQRSLGEPTSIYPYWWPDGRLSHFKIRWGDGKEKQIRWQRPDFTWGKPDTHWPIYGSTPPPGVNLVLCEGEKAVDALIAARETYDEAAIFAMTAGSKEDCLNAIEQWVPRLAELRPQRVLIWPDRDLHMAPWTKQLAQALRAVGINARRINPKAIYPEIPKGGGPDDFLENGGTLERAFSWRFNDALSDPKVVQFLDDLEIVEGDRVRIPHTRALRPLKKEYIGAFWTAMHGTTISRGVVDPIFDQLLSRDPASFTEVCHRRWHNADCMALVWRGDERSRAVVVDRLGVRYGDDPDRVLIRCPKPPPGSYSAQVDPEGSQRDLIELCYLYGLDTEHAVMIEGWIATAMIGLQTPVLLLRGEAGSGKTTFARALISILEPACPGLQLDDDRNVDERGLVNALRQSVAVLLDNVGALHPSAENRLCRVVTGDSLQQRRLYSDEVDMLSLRRALVITSISWTPKKPDLRDRMLSLTMPTIDRWLPESEMSEQINHLLPRIRSYLFGRIAHYYQRAPQYRDDSGELRIADWGRYLGVQGVDTHRLAALVARDRQEQLDEGDHWVGAVVDLWRAHWSGRSFEKGDFFRVTAQAVVNFMASEDIEPPASPRSQFFRKWMEENNPRWKEYGFRVRYVKSNTFRGYDFRAL